MEVDGVRKLILIPQTQYQQLIQNQMKTENSAKTKDTEDEHSESNLSLDNSQSPAEDSASCKTGLIHGNAGDECFGETEGNLHKPFD